MTGLSKRSFLGFSGFEQRSSCFEQPRKRSDFIQNLQSEEILKTIESRNLVVIKLLLKFIKNLKILTFDIT